MVLCLSFLSRNVNMFCLVAPGDFSIKVLKKTIFYGALGAVKKPVCEGQTTKSSVFIQ